MLRERKVLVLAPHTDDGELGCGATIARAQDEGATVFYAAFSTAEESVPEGFPRNQLEKEVRKATRILKIKPDNLLIYKYEVRKLNYVRQEILEELIKIRERINPDLVFLPSLRDIHQDHQVIAAEGLRAFKNSSLLGYELIWNNRTFDTDCFIMVQPKHVALKIKALQAYVTQQGKGFMEPAFIEAMARVRGTQIGVEYAEAFEVIRWII
ncbi:MAG: PIG-L family deacetylase [Saprospiraceae bacterium]|nr:PIG-L family deacetylase [Saprospiraceae bacterium]